jgi:RNA polymerase sigma-70 factor (ECF subfamily)
MTHAATLPVLSFSLCLCGGIREREWHNAGMSTEPAPDCTSTATDADLVTQCARGNYQAFHELTTRYYRPVCSFLFKRVQAPDLVEDLAQETFLEALQSLKAGGRPTHFSSWLFGIAHNRCGKWFRRKRPTLYPATEPPDILASPSFLAAQEELEEQQKLLAALDRGLTRLPLETQKLLQLKHREGKTCEQIAAALGQPVGTVKSNLSRAYKSLRASLTSLGGPSS